MTTVLETPPTRDDNGEIIPLDFGITPKFELSRLMAVAIVNSGKKNSGELMWRAQMAPNGPWEKDWRSIDAEHTYGIMSAGLTGDGRVAVVAQATTFSLGVQYITETEDASGSDASWNPPVDIGLPTNYTFDFLYTAVDADGRVEVFGIDHESGGLWWIYQNPDQIVTEKVTVTPPGASEPITIEVQEKQPPKTPWSSWCQLGTDKYNALAAANTADDRIILFGTDKTSGALMWSEQTKPQALTADDWTGWQRLDNDDIGPLECVTAVLDPAGAVNVFGIDKLGQAAHIKQSPPNSKTWSAWSRPGMTSEKLTALTAGIDGDGHIALVAQGVSHVIYGNMQTSVADAQWNTWQPIMPAGATVNLALNYNADGRLSLFRQNQLTAKDAYTKLLSTSQMQVNATEWEAVWTPLAGDTIRQFAVVRDLTPPTGG